jgi:hypothetical protein
MFLNQFIEFSVMRILKIQYLHWSENYKTTSLHQCTNNTDSQEHIPIPLIFVLFSVFEIFSDENKFNNSCIAGLHIMRWPWCTAFIKGFQVVPRTQPAVPWLWEISTRQNKQNTFLNGRCTLWVLTIKHRWSI